MSTPAFDDALLARLEHAAVDAARQAGALVAGRFGGVLEVSNKGKVAGADLVTDVDRASQKLIESLTVERFPGHMLLGEEDAPAEPPPAADWVWAVDPIDGTTNFVNGLPVHAVSVAVLHRGKPVAGAVWVPWPADGGAGAILHARVGGGAWFIPAAAQGRGARRLEIKQPEGDGAPITGRLSGLPAWLFWAYRVGKPLRKAMGEPRVSGSTAYESAMVAAGVMQFSVSGSGSHVWDYAATSLLVLEAGGAVFLPDGKGGWARFEGWRQPYTNERATMTALRDWAGSVIMSTPGTAAFLAANLSPRGPSAWRRAKKALSGPGKTVKKALSGPGKTVKKG
ncbi:MAG: inositol monophosphatase [Dehalococcoidia bacterium]|nr:inositol monophosphatase [Dehalococcoidia bacterium]MSQ35007.1 inositol monophosphatase [Dehalococcoidia bacterium]